MDHDDTKESYYDAGRYDTAAGWDGTSRGKKADPPPPRKAPLFALAGEEEVGLSTRPLKPLFGDLWGEREIAVLAGETGVGKSVLTVQLAELLARGRLSPTLSPKRVIYVDFEHTTSQFEDRYCSPRRPGHTARRVRFQFSKKFQRVVPRFDQTPEKKFGRDVGRYFCNELGRAIDEFDAHIAIVDNLSFLMMGGGGSRAAEQAMLALRLITRTFTYPVSILVTACLRDRRVPRPIELRDLACSSRIAELADSVFALGRSTAGDDLRYLKHLKSRTAALTLTGQNTPVLRLSRLAEPPSITNAGFTPDGSLSTTRHLQLTAGSPLPFLGLTHIGFSDESVHIYDPVKQAQLDDREVRRKLRRSENIVEIVMSPEYQRYLNR
ncbi:MAG: AAA family ATPase [Acidobacteriota bacterium]